jgi:hypothetical protein
LVDITPTELVIATIEPQVIAAPPLPFLPSISC